MRLMHFGCLLLMGSLVLMVRAYGAPPQQEQLIAVNSVAATATTPALQPFVLSQLRLTDGPFYQAQQTNLQYLRDFDINRLLAPFWREAGLVPKAPAYGNWESSGLDGHIGGHYLSALALAVAATADPELNQRLDLLLAELVVIQQAYAGADVGYLGGIPGGQLLWQQVRSGHIQSDLFSLNQSWVPLYNLHKTMAGLTDVWLLTHKTQAKTLLLNLGQWFLRLNANLSHSQIQQLLVSEHGGLNETLVDLYDISGDDAYLRLAQSYSQQSLLAPLLRHEDQLSGLHANTQIPKVIGFWRVGGTAQLPRWQQAAQFFYQTVTERRSVVIGGNSVREHFHQPDDFSPMLEDVEGPETCNTYNMLKLAKLLFLQSGDVRYLSFYERASYNHILSSQHPDHGGLVYFTPLRAGHYRVYSSHDKSMWCCVGSGLENHSKYAELIYSRAGAELLLNLFIPSTLDWPEQGLQLQLDTLFPDDNQVLLTVLKATAKPQQLSIRVASWQNAPLQLQLNGKTVTTSSIRPGYLTLTAPLKAGDKLSFTLDPMLRLEQLPGAKAKHNTTTANYAVLYGPVALAQPLPQLKDEQLQFIADDSRMGHIAAGAVCPQGAAPLIVGEPDVFLQQLRRLPGPLAFAAPGLQAVQPKFWQQQPVAQLVPFFRVHDQRYQIYLQQVAKAAYPDFVARATAKAAEEQALIARTLDQIQPGQQQPEVEHQYQGQASQSGNNNGRHWRDSREWFSYQLTDTANAATVLRLEYFSGDAGRQFLLLLNDQLLAEVTLAAQANAGFYHIDYAIPAILLKRSSTGKHQLKFVAKPGSVAGGIYGIRLLKPQR
ncbi:beta-L-arabinofuranosidase domain-containing protein [Rheinheimera sp.]|uniref:beta-L-arabinofuranosidase domain-containing protein n=1 Tax=Rheinheimera sp. TaxID=1869214 RepID=UPI0027B8C7DD|nr:beta-L-arabinofuranosidase domain-containing protein [Rheinheimera sp.]